MLPPPPSILKTDRRLLDRFTLVPFRKFPQMSFLLSKEGARGGAILSLGFGFSGRELIPAAFSTWDFGYSHRGAAVVARQTGTSFMS